MLKARGIITVKNMEELQILKEVLFMDLIDSGLVEEINFFRDRISPDGKTRSDLTIEITPSDTGRYPKGVKAKINKIMDRYSCGSVYF